MTAAPGGPRSPGPPRTGVYTQPVPHDVAGSFRTLTGLDLSEIPVHRGPAVSEQARAYQARAFTRSGEIFLPDEAGPLGHSETRALLAHELTHAVQQRMLSHALPDETSPHGQELEGEASDAEQWFRSGGSPPPRLAHFPVATLLAAHAGLSTAARGPSVSTATVPSGPTDDGGVQRQPGSHGPAEATTPGPPAPPVSGQPGPSGVSATDTLTSVPGLGDFGLGAGLPRTEDGAVAAQVAAAAGDAAGQKELAELIERSTRLVELSEQRLPDLDDPGSLDELTGKVYPRLRRMLRAELLVDRERAGLLADIS